MHLYNCIWAVLLDSRLNLAFLSPKLPCVIDKVLLCLCPCGFDYPRNTLRWKLLQLASIRLKIILFGLRTANTSQCPSTTRGGQEAGEWGSRCRLLCAMGWRAGGGGKRAVTGGVEAWHKWARWVVGRLARAQIVRGRGTPHCWTSQSI
jgi:hypothetical protein